MPAWEPLGPRLTPRPRETEVPVGCLLAQEPGASAHAVLSRPPGGSACLGPAFGRAMASLRARVTGISSALDPREQARGGGGCPRGAPGAKGSGDLEDGSPLPTPRLGGGSGDQGFLPDAQSTACRLRGALRIKPTLLARCPWGSASHWGRERNRGAVCRGRCTPRGAGKSAGKAGGGLRLDHTFQGLHVSLSHLLWILTRMSPAW